MPKIVKEPYICPDCDKVWEHVSKYVGENSKYQVVTLYYSDLPKIGRKKKVCDACK